MSANESQTADSQTDSSGSSEYESQTASSSGSDSDDSSEAPMAYSFEPSASSTDSSSSSQDDDDNNRLLDTSWCTCGKCTIMATTTECVCCREVGPILTKINTLNDTICQCITDHPGFDSVCMNVWVLQTAYYQYRQHYGLSSLHPTLHEKYRYTAYRQLTRWCCGWLGKNNRMVLPACAVKKIRDNFPSGTYKGFCLPSLS